MLAGWQSGQVSVRANLIGLLARKRFYSSVFEYSRILLRDAKFVLQWPMLHQRARESQIREGVIAKISG